MNKSGIALLGLLVVAGLSVAAPANAASYLQGITENGVGTFTSIDAFVFSPSGNLTLSGFSDGSWAAVNNGPRWSVATGNGVTSLNFNVAFDYVATPFVYDFYAFDGSTMVDSARFTFDGGLSVVDPLADPAGTYAADVASAAPEPAIWAIMLIGFFGVGAMMRRSRGQEAMLAA